ncbi:MAG: SDR family NAD(P)-dependent oxidoreductase [Burkholderiaceae bacterium]
MRLASQVAVVTGANSGLGLGTTRMLVEAGCVIVALDRAIGQVDALAAASGGCAIAIDVTDYAGVDAVLRAEFAERGAARILVNCAGVVTPGALVRRGTPQDPDWFRRVVAINLTATFNTIRVVADCARHLDPDDGGERAVIVNTASVAAWEGLSGQAAYAASKGGVAALSLPLAREFARYGIRVVAIAPGVFGTPMIEAIPVETRDTLIADVPFPHRPGLPTEFAAMVRAIVTNPMLNGTNVRLDAALRMQEPRSPVA